MKALIKTSAWILFVILVFVLQTNRFLSFKDVNPNLILLTVFLGVFLGKNILRFLFLMFLVVLLAIIFLPFWLKEVLITLILGAMFFPFKKRLTGDAFFDFSIMIFFGSLGFYSLIDVRYSFVNPMAIAVELAYNIALGFLIFLGIRSFSYEKEKRIES